MARKPPNHPMNWRGKKDVKARRVRLKPQGLTWVMQVTRKFEKVCP